VCKSIKTTKLVQDRSSSAMLEEHGSSRSTRSSRLARQSNVSSRVEPSGIWAYHAWSTKHTSCRTINCAYGTKHLSKTMHLHMPCSFFPPYL